MLLVIAAPWLQKSFQIFTPGPLYGNFTLADNVKFTWAGWMNGTYQEQKTKYINDHIGFREDLIRINNQIDLSLFEVLHADVVLGRNRYLYQQCYVDEHYGKGFAGYDYIRNMCTKLRYIQDCLSSKGKTLLIISPPTKDDIYPECLPYLPALKPTTKRNSIACRYFYDSLHINYIDIDTIFKKEKPKSREALFTRQGIHWSIYGSYIATDTIIKWLEAERHIKLPELHITAIEHTNKARFTDNDLGWPLNLIIHFARETYAYPVAKYTPENVSNKPSVVLVGDSFNWSLITNGLMDNAFSKWQFWYYFKNVKNKNNMDASVDALSMNGYNWKGQLDSADCLIINYTPHNLNELNCFTDSAYNYYYSKQ